MYTEEEIKNFEAKGEAVVAELDKIDKKLDKLQVGGPLGDAIEQAMELNVQRIELLLKLIRIPQVCGHKSCKFDADGRILTKVEDTVGRMINVCASVVAREVIGEAIGEIAKEETKGCTLH